MKVKNWLIGWFVLTALALTLIAAYVYKVDPYFHFHAPDTDTYYYVLDNQRSQNNGISKNFEYDAILTGTSMTENFKTSDMNRIFGVNSIKVSYSGGSFKEINDNLAIALENNSEVKYVVRGLDLLKLFEEKDTMRTDLGEYPTYLYDNNIFNDVKYIYNKDIIFGKAYAMSCARNEEGFVPGITAFDDYSSWQKSYTFGANVVIPDGLTPLNPGEPVHLTEEEKELIHGNITQNVTDLADKYPNVDFYYFFTPYSAVWWKELVDSGRIYAQIEAEEYIIELILEHENIHFYSFNNCPEITGDLNNYKDPRHYAAWVNSLILSWMHDGRCLMTKDNYKDYINSTLSLYLTFDYDSLNGQVDFRNDYYSAAIYNYEITKTAPEDLITSENCYRELYSAQIVEEQYQGALGIQCNGCLKRDANSDESVKDYIISNEFVGAKIKVDDIGLHKYLVFYCRKIEDNGQPSVYILDDNGETVFELVQNYQDLDTHWYQYVVDLSDIDGGITIYLNGGYVDNTGSSDSVYVFSNIVLY